MHILLNLAPTGISNAEGKNLKRYYEKYPAPRHMKSWGPFLMGPCNSAALPGKRPRVTMRALETQEEYTEYRQNTSILIPMVGYRYIPLSLKRPILGGLGFRV